MKKRVCSSNSWNRAGALRAYSGDPDVLAYELTGFMPVARIVPPSPCIDAQHRFAMRQSGDVNERCDSVVDCTG